MNIILDLNTILTTTVGGLVTYGLIGIRRINQKLSDLNGGMREFKVWKEEHEKKSHDDVGEIRRRIERLEETE